MTAAGGQEKNPDQDADLAGLADEFPGWDFGWWRGWAGKVIHARRKPVTALSEWVLRPDPDEVRAEIRHREQNPPEG